MWIILQFPLETGPIDSVDKVFEAATVHIYCGLNANITGISLTFCCSEPISCQSPFALASICTLRALHETLQTPLHTSSCLYATLCNVFCINQQPNPVFQIRCLNPNATCGSKNHLTDAGSEQKQVATGLTLVLLVPIWSPAVMRPACFSV